MVHQELSDRPRPDGRRERLSRHAAGDPLRRRRLAAHGARGARASRRPRHRRRSDDADRRAADRPAAADRDRPRALLRRPHHHPRRADLGACRRPRSSACSRRSAGFATAAAASSSSRISSTTSCASPTRSRSSATAGRSLTAPVAEIDKRQVIEQHDRHRPPGARGELYRRDQARHPPRRAGRAGGRAGSPSAAPSATSRSRSAPARCSASTASWAAARSSWRAPSSARSSADGALRLDGKPLRLTRTSTPREEGIAFVPESRRAMLFHHEPLYKNMSISILERISRLSAEAVGRAAASRAATSRTSASGRRAPISSSAIFPAATSRRSRSPSG